MLYEGERRSGGDKKRVEREKRRGKRERRKGRRKFDNIYLAFSFIVNEGVVIGLIYDSGMNDGYGNYENSNDNQICIIIRSNVDNSSSDNGNDNKQ